VRIAGIILSMLVLASPVAMTGQEKASAQERFVPPSKFDPARDAARDIQAATAEAKRTGRRVLLDVGGEWCIWCYRLDSLFASDRDLQEFRDRNFVVLKVNWSRENKNEVVLSHYPKIPGYPHLFVLDGDGKLLHSQGTGFLESGKHHDPDKVMAFLKEWAPR
jgi:thiol:disulfide interchange protein